MQLNFSGFEPGHFRGFFHQPIQAITLFIDDSEKFMLLGISRRTGSEKIGGGSLNGSERRAEIVSNGIQERRLEALALALGLGFADLLDGTRSLDGNGNE